MKKMVLFLSMLALTGCGIHVPVIDVATVTPEALKRARRINVVESNSTFSHPEISETLGNITAYSCRKMLNGPPATVGDALIQLRLNAVAMGADGIKDLAYDSSMNNLFCLNCWGTVKASGVAVKYKK